MLNLTRLHLGIAHESQFQGLGIIRSFITSVARSKPSGSVAKISAASPLARAIIAGQGPGNLCQPLFQRVCGLLRPLQGRKDYTIFSSELAMGSIYEDRRGPEAYR
jgi:hypothetical protein